MARYHICNTCMRNIFEKYIEYNIDLHTCFIITAKLSVRKAVVKVTFCKRTSHMMIGCCIFLLNLIHTFSSVSLFLLYLVQTIPWIWFSAYLIHLQVCAWKYFKTTSNIFRCMLEFFLTTGVDQNNFLLFKCWAEV